MFLDGRHQGISGLFLSGTWCITLSRPGGFMFAFLYIIACHGINADSGIIEIIDPDGPVSPSHQDPTTFLAVDTAVEESCNYELQVYQSNAWCFETRPYFFIQNETAVNADGSATISWQILVSAALEGPITVNTMRFWLSYQDQSGSGWTDPDIEDRLTFIDQNGETHGVHVVYGNSGGRSLTVGEEVSAQGDVAVPSVAAGEMVTIILVLNVDGMALSDGDEIRLDLTEYQTWSTAPSEYSAGVTTEFARQEGTTFMFW